jgi:hypothetical protein
MEHRKMLFDACSSSSEPRLLQLAGLKDPEISKAIANNVFISPAVASELFPDYPHEVMGNPTFLKLGKIDPQFTQDLFAQHYQVVPKLILPVTWFRYLLEHPSADVRRAAASNPNLPKQFHESCAQSKDTALRMGIASNKNVTYSVLNKLRQDPDSQIKAIAIQNQGNYSLTIKLPSPVTNNVAVVTDLQSNNLFATQTTTLQPPNFSESPTQLQAAGTSEPNRSWLLQLLAGLFLFGLAAWMTILLWGNKNSPTIASKVPAIAPTTTNASNDTSVATMNQVVDIANEASLAAKSFPDKAGWTAIAGQWQQAITLLESIPANSPLHENAQTKIKNYKVIMATAERNAQ